MADSVRFTGGRIWTGHRYVEALLVEDGRVVAAGSDREVRRARPAGGEDRDLGGRLLLPGLIDAHLHLADITRVREGLDLHPAHSVAELLVQVASWAQVHSQGAIVGRGWDQERMGGTIPTREDLDRVSRDRIIVLYHASGHMAVANGAALEAAGYRPGTDPPPGGRLGRAADGRLDGRVYERALDPIGRVWREAEAPAPDGLARTLALLAQFGLTSVCTMTTDPFEYRWLRELSERLRLPVRVRCYAASWLLDRFSPAQLVPPAPDERLGLIGSKSFADGAFGPRTAWLSQPYADAPDETGVPTLTGARLDDAVATTVQRGLAPAVHAIGDQAVEEVIRAYARMAPAARAPPRIEHLGLVPPRLHEPLVRARPTLVVQPGFVWSDRWLGERLGPQRVRWAYPFRTLLQRGLALVGSSDAPYDAPDPWRGLAAAVRRVGPDGGSANPSPEEELPPEWAMQLYTVNAGVGLGQPGWGSLEPGSPADLVIHTAPDIARAIAAGAGAVEETWAEGVPVYARGAAAGR